MDLDKKQAAHIANFVQFAYNMFSTGGLQPPPDPGIQAAGYQLIAYLDSMDFQNSVFYGYIAASIADPSQLVVAVRGTQTPQEWLLDLIALPVPFSPMPDAGFVALGFQSIFEKFLAVDLQGNSGPVRQFIENYSARTAIRNLAITGHSLGSALATLIAADIALLSPDTIREALEVYTFASPRVGLLDFAASFNKSVPVSFRIWNVLDIVPETPTFPYIHVSGHGDAIAQTESQLSTLLFTPVCEHHLTSYQWLLDPAEFNLQNDCRHAAVEAMAGARAISQPSVGAQQLRKAMSGRL